MASEVKSQESEAVPKSSWFVYARSSGIVLLIAVFVALVPLLWREGREPEGLVTAYILVGPLLAVGLVVVAAFRFRNSPADAGSAYGGAPGVTVALAGLACLVVAAVVPATAPELASSWTIGVVLEAAGVLTIGAAMVLASRGRALPRKPVSDDPRDPYDIVGLWPKRIKAFLQMLVGLGAIVRIAHQSIAHSDGSLVQVQDVALSHIGLALSIAAAIELAYTLFTPGPDEALDPLMLGLSAALILQLGRVDNFNWTQALAALLYTGALGGLFAVRKYLLPKFPDARRSKSSRRAVHGGTYLRRP